MVEGGTPKKKERLNENDLRIKALNQIQETNQDQTEGGISDQFNMTKFTPVLYWKGVKDEDVQFRLQRLEEEKKKWKWKFLTDQTIIFSGVFIKFKLFS